MGDREKARKELEELYLGVPDESVNLTFQDLAQVRHQNHPAEKKKATSTAGGGAMGAIPESSSSPSKSFAKLPSVDFTKALQSCNSHDLQNHTLGGGGGEGGFFGRSTDNVHGHDYDIHHAHAHVNHMHGQNHNIVHHASSPHHVMNHMHAGHGHHGLNLHSRGEHGFARHHHHGVVADQRSGVYDDMSRVSGGMSAAFGLEEGARRRRPGIPHSNICTICCEYIYFFRHRCLVCGRVYCRQCVNMGMGDMNEGRKCIECLGRRFSLRYITRAGNVGWCMGYPSRVKQAELRWAEKGARRGGYDPSVMVSRSRSPAITPTRPLSPINPPSFVATPPYSPCSPATHHALPF